MSVSLLESVYRSTMMKKVNKFIQSNHNDAPSIETPIVTKEGMILNIREKELDNLLNKSIDSSIYFYHKDIYGLDTPSEFEEDTSAYLEPKDTKISILRLRLLQDLTNNLSIKRIPINNAIFTNSKLLELLIGIFSLKETYGVIAKLHDGTMVNLGHSFNPIYRFTPKIFNKVIKELIIYSYRDLNQFEPLKRDFSSRIKYKVNKEKILWNSLNSLWENPIGTTDSSFYLRRVNFKNFSVKYTNNYLNSRLPFRYLKQSPVISTNEVVDLPESEHRENCLIPLFFITKGIYFPWYGVAHTRCLSKTFNIKKGASLTSFKTANIQWTQDNSSQLRAICTGSLPNTVYDSLRALNHVNMGSPFWGHIVPVEYMELVEIHKNNIILAYSEIIQKEKDNEKENNEEENCSGNNDRDTETAPIFY